MMEYRVLDQQIDPDCKKIALTIQLGPETHTLSVETNSLSLSPSTEAVLAIGLLPSMKVGATAVVSGPVSPRFLAGLARNQEVFRSWKPGYHPVNITGAQMETPSHPPGGRVGVFFSTGVDSYYSFFKHQSEVTDLIYLAGYDITTGDSSRFATTLQAARRAAQHYGVNLVEVTTNLREFTSRYVFWGMAHGSVMAGIGHLFSAHFRRLYIAASLDLERQIHWGTHPQLDPNWSSENLEFIHDGVEARRIDKIARLASEDVALQNLRVCLYPPREKPNCGRCEKCVRTMIALQAVGALDRCDTFAAPLDLKRVYHLYAPEDRLHTAFVAENLEVLEKNGADPELAATLRKVQGIPWPVKRLLRFLRQLRSQKHRRA